MNRRSLTRRSVFCIAAAATPATRFKVVQALAARGCADVALDVLRARSAAGGGPGAGPAAEPLEEAEVALGIRLDCNLVTEAFMEVSPSVFTLFLCAFTLVLGQR